MKSKLTLFFLLTVGLLSGQSNFQRAYGPPSERSQELAVAVLVNAATVTAVYSAEGGTMGQSTLEFVQTNPADGSLISQTSFLYPFAATVRATAVVLEDSILVIARMEAENIVVSRLNANGDLLSNIAIPDFSADVNNFRLVAAPEQAVALVVESNILTTVLYLEPDSPSPRVTTIDSSSGRLLDLAVMPDGNYLFYTRQGPGYSTLLVDAQTGNTIRENSLPDADGADNFAGSRFLTDPTDGSTILVLLKIETETRAPYVYRLDSVGRAIADPNTLGILPPESIFLYGFTPDGQLVYSVRELALFAYPDYRQPNNQALPIASLPDDLGRIVNDPKVGYAPDGAVYFSFTSCFSNNNCDVVLTQATLSTEAWRVRLGIPGRATNDLPTLIDTDPNGNIYLLSQSPGPEGTNLTTSILKLNPDGDSIWTHKLTTPQVTPTRPLSMVFRGDGLLFVQHNTVDTIYTDVLTPDGTSAHPQFTEERLELVLVSGRIKAIDVGGGVVLNAGGMDSITVVDIHRADGSRRSSFTSNKVSAPNALARLEGDFAMIMGREPRPPYRFAIVKYDLAEGREIWSQNLGNPTTLDVVDFAEDIIVLPDGDYLLAADTWNFAQEDDLEGINLYRISPEGVVELTAYLPQEVFNSHQPLKLAVNAAGEPILISYTGENGAKIFRTVRLDPSDLSVLETTNIVLPESFGAAGNFTFSRNGFALAYGSIDPEGDRSTQLYVVSEDVIDNPVGSAAYQPLAADIELSPNPTSGPTSLRVKLQRPSTLTLEIIDAVGKKTFVADYPSAVTHRIRLSAAQLPSGLSLLRITDGAGRYRSLRLIRVR